MKGKVIATATLFISLTLLQGCTAAVIAGAAGTAGYLAHENGYRVENPIKKTGK